MSEFNLDLAAASLSDTKKVDLGFAWQPETGSLIVISELKVNGKSILPNGPATDLESPFWLPAGSFKSDTTLEISWALRTYNDLVGIALFMRVEGKNKWEPIKDQGLLGHQMPWKDKTDAVV